jgi:hypothetical protein
MLGTWRVIAHSQHLTHTATRTVCCRPLTSTRQNVTTQAQAVEEIVVPQREQISINSLEAIGGLLKNQYGVPYSKNIEAVDAICGDGSLYQATMQREHTIVDGITKVFSKLAVDVVPKLYFCVPEAIFDMWVAEQPMAYQTCMRYDDADDDVKKRRGPPDQWKAYAKLDGVAKQRLRQCKQYVVKIPFSM